MCSKIFSLWGHSDSWENQPELGQSGLSNTEKFLELFPNKNRG